MTVNDLTLALAFESRAKRFSERTFLREKIGPAWHDHSWSEIAEVAGRLRSGLMGTGVRAGDRVAILAENCPQWVIADQAVLGLGAIVVPLYTTSGAEETAHVINDSGAQIVAVRGDHALRKILGLASSMPKVERIIAMDRDALAQDGAANQPSVVTLDSLSRDVPAPVVAATRDDVATLIYTSGTTGPSKGAMLSHGNILANCEGALNALELDDRDVILSVLPIAHSFERTAGYYTVMMCGGTIAYAEGLGQIAQNLLEIRPTVMLTVPRFLEVVHNRVMRAVTESGAARRALFHVALAVGKRAAWYRHRARPVPPPLALLMATFRKLVFARIRGLFGDRLRYLISGGAPLGVEIFEFLAAAEVPIFEGYGLTEAAPVVSVNLPGRTRIGTVGRPLVNVEVHTAEDGELLVRGRNVMKGYFGRAEESREAIDSAGWLHTGDIARIDPDGFIQITDRKKEIIVLSSGKNVSPANLENRLQGDPFIAQACVVGDRRKHLAALIVPDFENLAEELQRINLAGRSTDELVDDPAMRALFQRRLREFNRSLSDVEAITAFTLVARPFAQESGELTPTLKLRRRVVQAHYRAQVEAMYRD